MRNLPCVLALAAAAAAAAPQMGSAGDTVRITEQQSRWESGYGSTFFNIVGKLTNAGDQPVRYVRLKAELLDKDGKVVASTDFFNYKAEGLGRDDLKGSLDDKLAQVKPQPIPPDGSDNFRCSFLKEETPPFATHRVTVTAVGQ
jgi:hypothetical protein